MAKQILELAVGTLVQLTDKAHVELRGMFGIIVEHLEDTYGIELDHSFDVYLHDCNGKATPRWGWYCKPEEVEEMVISYNCRTSVRDKEILKQIRTNTDTCLGGNDYEVKVNGAIVTAIRNNEKIMILSNGKVARLNPTSKEDEIYLNHVLEVFKAEEGKSIKNLALVAYTDSDTPKEGVVETPIEEVAIPEPPVLKKSAIVTKEYATEEEMLKDLGIK